MKTLERLAEALRQANAPESMIADALLGRYDDFKSESDTPIVDLVFHCQNYGLKDIARRAMKGEFDSTKEESNEWFEREGKDLLNGDNNAQS